MTSEKFRVKPHYSLVTHSSDCVELRSGVWNTVSHIVNDDSKSGNLFRVLRELNGIQDNAEISHKLNLSRSDVESVVDHLKQLGVLEAGASSAFDSYLNLTAPAFLKGHYFNAGSVQSKFPLLFLGDVELSGTIMDFMRASFGRSSIKFESDDLDVEAFINQVDSSWMQDNLKKQEALEWFEALIGKFVIISQRHIDPIYLKKWNILAFHLNIPWMHIAMDGPFLFIGPIFSGGTGPCYECLETRVFMNLREQESYQRYKAALVDDNITHQEKNSVECLLDKLLSSHAALEITNFILTETSFVKNKVLAIYLPTMEFSFNEVLRLSGCHTCGSLRKRDDTQLYFDFHALI